MTVGSQVKSCFASIKSAEATLQQLQNKTENNESRQAFEQAATLVNEARQELEQQVIYLTNEEPQYK
ncbi:DUF1657 domain-containing protein [Virgibacillus sp. W0181]|uniref:DUF1657 domain-containing protein n=1 Tax=Virgibacillus sp. W0181 TaxID=3391581 RepID=UPI003F44B66D